jgi:hypothetical protein
MPFRHVRSRSAITILAPALTLATVLLSAEPLFAQEPLRPGEAFVTRFSGTRPGAGGPVIDINGTVGSIIDLRAPGKPPQGQHWIDEPQRNPVSAGQVGQVFGVALDDATPPNIYLAATSAFGLHRASNNAIWMPGLFGEGGPGAIYRLDAANGYAPRLFATIVLSGRPNSGAALGNLAYDRINKQLLVSDLETGMVHRIRAADGSDLGVFDHGTQGRSAFLDVETGQQGQLPPIAFDPSSQAHIADCPTRFDQTPQCWNFAASGRRIWGLAVQRNPAGNETRLYYAVWSGPAFDLAAWNQQSEDDKRNSVWSVRLGPDGGFAGDVRREFIVPDFFTKPQDIARAGYSQPVSDIAFAPCGPRPVMLVAERGGIRNLGLSAQNPFATPHEARALRYELDRNGTWHDVGRYDVGFYDRQKEGEPRIRANCAGGIAFGLGYTNQWTADPGKPDQFVWITGDSLCSPDGPCNLPGTPAAAQQQGADPQQAALQNSPLDESEVHGVQGLAETAFEPIDAAAANPPARQDAANFAAGPSQAYMIDTDLNIDAQGRIIEAELTRNDATKIGDIAIYEICEGPADYAASFLLQPGPEAPPVGYHYRSGSHSTYWSHNRFGSHNPYWSHNREASHNLQVSHWRQASHDRRLSHRRGGSHDQSRSHWRNASHDRRLSHLRQGSHDIRASHRPAGSHDQRASHRPAGSHDQRASHRPEASHDARRSHAATRSHNTAQSQNVPKNTHSAQRSHAATGSHTRAQSAGNQPPSRGGQPKAIQRLPQRQIAPRQQFVPRQQQLAPRQQQLAPRQQQIAPRQQQIAPRQQGGQRKGGGGGGHDPRSSQRVR